DRTLGPDRCPAAHPTVNSQRTRRSQNCHLRTRRANTSDCKYRRTPAYIGRPSASKTDRHRIPGPPDMRGSGPAAKPGRLGTIHLARSAIPGRLRLAAGPSEGGRMSHPPGQSARRAAGGRQAARWMAVLSVLVVAACNTQNTSEPPGATSHTAGKEPAGISLT